MKRLLLIALFGLPLFMGAQNLLTDFNSLTSLPGGGNWEGSLASDVFLTDDGVNTSDKFVQMTTAALARDLRTTYNFKAGVTYRLSLSAKVSSTTGTVLETFMNFRSTSYLGTLQDVFVTGSNTNNSANLPAANKMSFPGAALTTNFKEVYASVLSPTDQTLYLRINRNRNDTANGSNYFYDNVTLKVLDCKQEPITVPDNGTSTVNIYEYDINNGAAINIGTNANVSSVNFYEADGLTNANTKFTLNSNGTITSISGTAGTNYVIKYTLTSTVDADGLNGLDTDTIAQTFAVTSSLSTSNFDQNIFSFYPNPTKDFLNLTSETEIKEVTIFTFSGQQVLSKKMNSLHSILNVSTLSKGIYLMKVQIGDTSKTHKIVIE